MKWGIDVSRWQGNFNFELAKRQGIEFAILKAGGGDAGLYTDGKFERNMAECARLGIPVGAYFFGQAMDTNQAMKEAEYFCKLLKGRQFPMKVWYDVEAKMLKAAGLSTIVITFIERVRAEGYECGIYASESNLKTLCKTAAINNYPHWTARWTKSKPSIPTEIWQFCGETNLIRSNKVAGVVCDQNYLMIDIPTPAPTPKPTVKKVKVTAEMPMIKKGDKGKAVKIWQIIVGVNADGDFGPATDTATKKWQSTHKDNNGKQLDADGIVGSLSWGAGLGSV